MRTIEWATQFKRGYKRESKGQYRVTLDDELFPVVECLANEQVLEIRYRDHYSRANGKIIVIVTSSQIWFSFIKNLIKPR